MPYRFLSQLVIAGTMAIVLSAQNFDTYPGAGSDEKAGRAASAQSRGTDSRVFTTSDPFEKVHAFYRTRYKEFAPPFPRPVSPDGQDVKWAFFILDGAHDLMHSKHWMKIQRPAINTVDESGEFRSVRDVTVIQTVRRP